MQAVCHFSFAPQTMHFNDCSYCIDEIRRINTSERAKLSSFLDIFRAAFFFWTAWCTRNNNQKVHSKLHLQKRVKMRSRPAGFFPLRGSGFQAGRRLRYVTTTADTFSRPPPEKKCIPNYAVVVVKRGNRFWLHLPHAGCEMLRWGAQFHFCFLKVFVFRVKNRVDWFLGFRSTCPTADVIWVLLIDDVLGKCH